jgi:RNA polymerase sigma-70 factor (ECF subfamily)
MKGMDLREGWRAAREAWPEVDVTEDELSAYLVARGISSAEEVEQGAAPSLALAYTDLYLACACARGDAAALRTFEKTFFVEVDAAVAKVGGAAPSADEIRQVLRHKLFIAEPDAQPKITEYGGRGPLRTWVRIIATRTALNLASRASRELPFEGEALTFLIGGGDDPELSYLKRLYAEEFRLAFAEAFDGLESRDRNLLRYAFGEGLTVDAIGSLYGVHRATAARWVAKAHADLADRLKKALVARLGVTNKDYSSILRLIASRFDITLERYMKVSEPGRG